MRNKLGIVSALLFMSATVSAQDIPVRIYAPWITDTTAKAAGSADGARLFEAYVKRRFQALGVPLTQSDTLYSLELHYNILPLAQRWV